MYQRNSNWSRDFERDMTPIMWIKIIIFHGVLYEQGFTLTITKFTAC